MRAKRKEIITVKDILAKFGNQPLLFKLSYDLSQLYKISLKYSSEYDEKRVKLIEEYKSGSEEDGTPIFEDERKSEFMKKISELLEEELEIKTEKVDLKTIPDEVRISLADMYKIEQFVVV